jgi:signal transduction histidine kinase/ActR/RegA family two-component response regulator
MSTASKLWLGFGLLLLLLIGIGLFVAHRLATIERALATIMAVQEPATATTYDMALNVSGTSAAVMRQVALGEAAPQSILQEQHARFERLIQRYDRIARSDSSRELGRRIHVAYDDFATLGDSLVSLSGHRRDRLTEFAHGGETMRGILTRDLVPRLDGRGKDGPRKLAGAARLEADIAGLGDAVGLYLHAPDAARRARIATIGDEFHADLRRLEELKLGDEEKAAAARLRAPFTEYALHARETADVTDQLQALLPRYTGMSFRLQLLVEQGIHSLARTDLLEAQQSALRAIHFGMIAVLVLLVAGIFIGVLTALPVARSVVGSERALRERMEELALTHQRKDEFLAVLGHELRNPLAPLRNSLSLLDADRESMPGRLRRVHDVMKRQVHDMTRLVDDLLDVSRVNQGKITLRREPLDLRAAVRQAAEDIRPLAQSRNIPLEIDLTGESTWVYADSTRLAQILANLLHNAVQYSGAGGTITLSLERAGRDAELRVRDQGVGIAPELLPRVFEAFTQLEGRLSGTHEGLGIGLTLVRRLAELHGGSVRAESPGPGRGSTFTLRLPRIGTPSPIPAPAVPARTAVHPRRVLVVDDNRDSADTLGELLALWGHDVAVAHDGPGALEVAEARHPEVVLLDIGLPGVDGYEVARRIRASAQGNEPLLIALTGLGQEGDRRKSVEAGFDHHLAKPVDPEALRDLIARGNGASV